MKRVISIISLFIILTILTQVGGLILLATLPLSKYIKDRFSEVRSYATPIIFVLLYLISVFAIVPLIASSFGRVQLQNSNNLQPINYLTILFNRNYVSPQLSNTIITLADQFAANSPNSVIAYLDGNFPFAFIPLFPHLSHSDGRKLDLAFFYTDLDNHNLNGYSPSWIGYGVSVDPLPSEVNTTATCRSNGYWQYDLLNRIVPQSSKDDVLLDVDRTRRLITMLASFPEVEKIFIEPHLKSRMNIESDKVRFHGCHAVRHDDHIHIQIK